eukprot:CAMPEP_0119015422 /NCGR_PEP_ID=MMETSP1176-20130426/10985_1 /TAXON_ID=265551 /ORGANISM="Synedropsis recta cf, Strain CCMP1620" /LENGTH=151 /DNA_ID=CAMNT_0006968713 /DNA_START=120 /DNA_END=575 /DNA_ORIENTATION=+
MSFKSLLLLFAVAISSCNGFVVSPSRPSFVAKDALTPISLTTNTETTQESSSTMLFSKTQLNYRNQDDEDFLYTDNNVVLNPAPTVAPKVTPKKIYLPHASQDCAQRKKAERMMDAEILLGRFAMMTAIVMLGTEVVVGTSLPDQIANFLN